MKKILLFYIIFFSIHISAFADHTYFPNEIEWTLLKTDCYLFGGDDDKIYRVKIKIEKDTIISNKKYQIIENIPIRSDGNKVYCYIKKDNNIFEDFLLYDFDLKVGDSILTAYPLELETNSMFREAYYNLWKYTTLYYDYVKEIDTIVLNDGRLAKKIEYTYMRPSDIEYIGSVGASLFTPISKVDSCFDVSLACCSVDGCPIYESWSNACSENNMIEDSENKQILFNIDNQILEIEIYCKIESVKIYYIDGTLVCNSFIDNNNIPLPCKPKNLQKCNDNKQKYYYYVDLSSLPSGNYILILLDEKGNKKTKKIIKLNTQ
ncbi:MAG: hypothetical protein IJS73_03885 [Paludibacteraceae bacterium]|nr:hypothetical protein [Paludibacteraceae bacterium]